jgi:hypothetical protein
MAFKNRLLSIPKRSINSKHFIQLSQPISLVVQKHSLDVRLNGFRINSMMGDNFMGRIVPAHNQAKS